MYSKQTNHVTQNDQGKCATGIRGLDELTRGGLPRGRTTLLLGSPGAGKTLMAAAFASYGAAEFNEPAIIVSLGQSAINLRKDVASAGFDLHSLESKGSLLVMSVNTSADMAVETGEYTLDGLFIQIERAIAKVSAKRVVLDEFDALLDLFEDKSVLRREFLRLSDRLAERGVTTLMTRSMAGRNDGLHRLEEYLADCVILMDHRISEQVATRRLRVLKYRGTSHGTDEYPFVITSKGLRVFPITSMALNYEMSYERVATGVPDLDRMLGGQGFHKGSAVLVSGTSGCGKTTLAAQFAASVARGGVKCAYFSFEESPDQIKRNMKSVGIDVAGAIDGGNLLITSIRPSLQGLEQHLLSLSEVVEAHGAKTVIIDPMTNLVSVGSTLEVKAMLTRLLDDFKSQQITVLLTSLISAGDESLGAEIGISSLMDTILSIDIHIDGYQRQRWLSVLKSRGTAHSHTMHQLVFSDSGIHLLPPERQGETKVGS